MASRSSFRHPLVTAYLRWTWLRSALHNGWWLVTSLYLVLDAGLTPSQLVLIGAVQSVFALFGEIPAGVLADTVSRKLSLVLSLVLMGTAMIGTGLVTSFPLLLATQVVWGLSWTFSSGADIAWITDELDRPDVITSVLARAARAQLAGAATGLAVLGALAYATRRDLAIVLAGSAMLLLAVYVVVRFTEERFVAARRARWSASLTVFRRGVALVRRSPDLRRIFLATALINGAADAGGRLAPKQLVDLGLPIGGDPVVWFTGLGSVGLLVGVLAIRVVGRRLDGDHARSSYGTAALIGAGGTALLAFAPDAVTGSVALVIVSGIAIPLTRVISTIWINARTTSDIRATTHSFLAQAEYLGEITGGVAIAAVAGVVGLPLALAGSAALYALTSLLMRVRRPSPPS
ncbi:MFS transporter [Kribbella amoyensis]|uniref:MFS transporter n=1 Tax=Kribbella amoyensis TaxID=996641 RepID=A0A561BTD1_9ACTN|nr:MFS transporter [Kribbella amoyensis]TWD82091.1 MFS transporter [Kribbella amoyensis]